MGSGQLAWWSSRARITGRACGGIHKVPTVVRNACPRVRSSDGGCGRGSASLGGGVRQEWSLRRGALVVKRPCPVRASSGWVVWHAALIIVLVVFAVAVVELTPPEEGFNFLLIVALLPLLGLGLPWSAGSVFLDVNYLVAGETAFWLLYTSPAVLNLALHALVRRWPAARAARTNSLGCGPEPAQEVTLRLSFGCRSSFTVVAHVAASCRWNHCSKIMSTVLVAGSCGLGSRPGSSASGCARSGTGTSSTSSGCS